MFDDQRRMTSAGRQKLLRAVLHLQQGCTRDELDEGLLYWSDLNAADAVIVINIIIARHWR